MKGRRPVASPRTTHCSSGTCFSGGSETSRGRVWCCATRALASSGAPQHCTDEVTLKLLKVFFFLPAMFFEVKIPSSLNFVALHPRLCTPPRKLSPRGNCHLGLYLLTCHAGNCHLVVSRPTSQLESLENFWKIFAQEQPEKNLLSQSKRQRSQNFCQILSGV